MKKTQLIPLLIFICLSIFSSVVFAGSSLLSWNQNTESDLAGYNIYYGTSSRSYGGPINVGKDVITYEFINLDEGSTYYYAVTAVDESGNESGYSDEVSKTIDVIVPPPVPPSSVSIGTDISSPQVEGTNITITAQANGGSGEFEYQFLLKGKATGRKWKIVQSYSEKTAYIWNTKGAAGKNMINVRMRNAGSDSSTIVSKKISYLIKSSISQIVSRPTSVDFKADIASPQVEGTLVTITASASGGSGSYEYAFLIKSRSTGRRWKIVRDYSPDPAFKWNTTGTVGKNRIRVLVKNAGSHNTQKISRKMIYKIKSGVISSL